MSTESLSAKENAQSSTTNTSETATSASTAIQEQCEECGGNIIKDGQNGESVCEDCGLVANQNEIDRGPDWQAFTAEEKREKSRVGAPTTKTMHDGGLSTRIGWKNKDSHGNYLSNRKRQRMERLRTWDERYRTQDAQDRNLKHALGEIKRMASSLGLNKQVEETASVIYRRCLSEDLLRGRSIEGVATACTYAAARQMNTPRSLDKVIPVSRVDANEIQRTYRYISRELGLEMEPVNPKQYLNRIINELNPNNEQELLNRAKKILTKAEKENLHSGKAPTSLAAAATYLATAENNQRITQEEIAEVADVSVVTIRNRYQEMAEVCINL